MRNSNTVRILLATCVVILLITPIAHAQLEVNPPREGVFFHIKSGTEDAHTILMPLSLALKMAATTDVVLFFDIKGIHVVLKDAPDLQYSSFESSHILLKKLLEQGIGVYVCPMCLNAEGKSADDLMEGVQVMTPEVFFGFTKGRILTLDY